MGMMAQVFFWNVVLALFIEIALIAVFLFKEERLFQEDSIKAIKRNSKTVDSATGLLFAALLFETFAEISELFVMEVPLLEVFESLHMPVLLLALILIAKITYEMGWKR
jgi:hypothetical protein